MPKKPEVVGINTARIAGIDIRRQLLESESEKDFALMFEQLLQVKHILFYHVYEQAHYARRSMSGFPDYLVFIPRKRIVSFENSILETDMVAVELKSEKGKLSPAQVACKVVLESCGIKYKLWRPSDWEEIVRILK